MNTVAVPLEPHARTRAKARKRRERATASYVDQNGRPVLMYDQFRQEDVTVSDLRNPPALTNPSLTVRYDSMLLQDVFTATWESDPDMSSAWKVWVDFYRDGVWVGAREVAATADQAGLSASGDGAIHRNHAVLTLK